MDIIKVLLLTIVPAIIAGCVIGVASGRHQVKKANNQIRRLLTNRQRAAYCASILIGVALVLTGIFYNPGGKGDIADGEMDSGIFINDEAGGVVFFDEGGVEGLEKEAAVMDENAVIIDGIDGETVIADEDESSANAEEEAVEELPEADSGSTTGGGTAAATPAPRRIAPFRASGGGGGVVIIR